MPDAHETRLSQMTTRWSLLARTHAADPSDAASARAEFLPRYCTPVFRYLHGILNDADLSEELSQEFALRFVRGDFRHFRPERGRFRDYLKASLRHLVSEWRRRPNAEDTLPPESRLLLQSYSTDDDDQAFTDVWRSELLNRVWRQLEQECRQRENLQHDALRFKADDPARKSATIAALLSERHGQPVTVTATRQLLHRARTRFAELLRAEIALTVSTPEPSAIDEELADLGLLVYCQST